jgi:prepilin-type N-terminal cleavage/methylation domain-containing protein
MFKNARRGFTLPEVLVTVTVVAVLAAVVVPAVTQYASKGDSPALKQDLTNLQTAVTSFTSDVRRYPGDLRQLVAQITTVRDKTGLGYDATSATTAYTASDVTKWHGPYTQASIQTGDSTAVLEAGRFTTNGFPVTIGRIITTSVIPGWLTTPIIKINGSTTLDCPSLIKLDLAVDGAPPSAGTEFSTGTIQWTQGTTACTTATAADGTGSAATSAVIRIMAAP